MAGGGHSEHLTWCLLLHCIVGPYVFILYIIFPLNVGYDNDDYALTLTLVITRVRMLRFTVFHKAL